MEPDDALTVSAVMSNARGVVMMRWVRKTNPMMTKQFIYHDASAHPTANT